MKRLLTIGHSYVVGLNRRLAHEMAVAGDTHWQVTAAAPGRYPGDLREILLEREPGEAGALVSLGTHLARVPHLMRYRGLRPLLHQRWDVVHCWEEPYVAAAAQVARLAPRDSRFVFATFQNIPKTYPWPLSAYERRVLGRADGWIAFGSTVLDAQRQRDRRYADLPSRVITPGVDITAFAPSPEMRQAARAALGWHDEVPVIGYVGRFVQEKGVELLLDALRRVQPPWRALFVGGGPLRPAVEAFARAHPADVRVIGDASHADVPTWMNAMDLLCAPSQTTPRWREQFGRMLVEAMACGVPVVASTSGEIPHVVGDAGVVVEEHDVDAWTAAVASLARDAARRQELGALGRARAIERFAWPVIARQHLAFFDRLTS